ncbi:MAG TPA: amidohydrolase family protein [Alphaproteobacteria bacterium]|nr:amidohydrolase family protein [Alphaproteobacteria bacterium]
MSKEIGAATPLIDHHCHGVMPADLMLEQFEDVISEAFAPAPAGTSHWDKPVALAIRRWCAPLLDLAKFAAPEDYVARRRELGAGEVNKRFMKAAGFEMLLVDSGNRPGELCSVEELGAIADVPAREVVRMESVAERVAEAGATSAAGYADAFEAALRATLTDNVVGLKTVVAYRATLAIDYTPPSAEEVARAAGAWLAEVEKSGAARITDAVLERHLIWTGADIAREKGYPVQFHIGIGDPDIELNKVDPSLLTPFIRAAEAWQFPITLLHCYPFHRHAGLIAENFPYVYFDVGFVQNWAGPNYQHIMDEALELAPFTKQLYSSDAFGLAELYYLGALRFRTSLGRALGRWIDEDELVPGEAERIVDLIGRANARRIYPLG